MTNNSSSYIRRGPTGWAVDFRNRGLRIRRKGFPTYKEAKSFYDSVLAGNTPTIRQSLEQAIQDYFDWSANIKRKSVTTQRSDMQRLGVFLDWANSTKIRNVTDVSLESIRAFQAYYFENAPFTKNKYQRSKKPNPAATWEKYRQLLSAFCNWCTDRNLMPGNPLSRTSEFKVMAHENKPPIFSKQELTKVLDYFDNCGSIHLSAFFRLLAYTGCRLSEAVNLKWENIDLDSNEIVFEETKNYKARAVPILPKLKKALKKLPNGHLYVFDNGKDDYLYAKSSYWGILKEATESLGIKPRSIHSFRHTFCSSLAELNINLVTIKELAGHKRIETTMRYIQFTQQAKRKAMLRLPF